MNHHKVFFSKLSYLAIRALLFPFSLLPYKAIHYLGRILGNIVFFLVPKYRKRSLSNLSIASDLQLKEEDIKKLAKASLGNLCITALEYGKLSQEKRIENIAVCVNPEEANHILAQGKGVIFFCAHQANWEILFLEGTSRMKGVAIGQPIENKFLYNWVMKMREKFGGKIINPDQAVKEGLRALKKNMFLGIVGDQGMPDSGFSCQFLGRSAYTSPLPALLSHRSGAPIIVATILRKQGKYFIHYSPSLSPDPSLSREDDVQRLMKNTLYILEESIKNHPDQWLWQHNKWKQQGGHTIRRKYRHDTMAIILPYNCEDLLKELLILRKLYPTEWITCFAPLGTEVPKDFASEIIYYKDSSGYMPRDYRFKLIFNFTDDHNVEKHFLHLAAFQVLSKEKISDLHGDSSAALSIQLQKVLSHAS